MIAAVCCPPFIAGHFAGVRGLAWTAGLEMLLIVALGLAIYLFAQGPMAGGAFFVVVVLGAFAFFASAIAFVVTDSRQKHRDRKKNGGSG